MVVLLVGAILAFVAACEGTPTTEAPVTKVTVEVTKRPTCPTEPAAVSDITTSKAPMELEISVKGDTLKFDKGKFEVDAGSDVAVAFTNSSTANQHNWVLVRAGTMNDVSERGSKCRENGYVRPGDSDVIAHTKLADPGEPVEVRFAAPPAGTYQFVCTFPGHNFSMFGDFVVIP